MQKFPTDFTDQPEVIVAELDAAGNGALQTLADRGLVVTIGLDKKLAIEITKMSRQEHIKEYCPKDCTDERFANEASTKRWLSRGHAVFVLAKKLSGGELHAVGYGWSGPKKTDEVPGGETTWAVRLGLEAVGQKLSEPFSQVILSATAKQYGAKNMWLETWKSNGAGVHAYGKLGFKLVVQKLGRRPTTEGNAVEDTRLFMLLP